MKLKRDKYDSVVSDLVRLQYHYTCRNCGAVKGKTQACHAAHIHGRGTGNATRYSLRNIVCLCASCHSSFGTDPVGFTRWLSMVFGDEYLDSLARLRARVYKFMPGEKDDMMAYYKEQIACLESARNAGVMGFIEVEDWFHDDEDT